MDKKSKRREGGERGGERGGRERGAILDGTKGLISIGKVFGWDSQLLQKSIFSVWGLTA